MDEYDVVNHLFSHLLFNIPESGKNKKHWKPKTKEPKNYGKLQKFSQKEFVGDDLEFGKFKEEGYVFIPEHCKHHKNCQLHVDFHPCKAAHDQLPDGTHLMDYAATNNIIVLWPYVRDCYDTETH